MKTSCKTISDTEISSRYFIISFLCFENLYDVELLVYDIVLPFSLCNFLFNFSDLLNEFDILTTNFKIMSPFLVVNAPLHKKNLNDHIKGVHKKTRSSKSLKYS